MIPCSYTVLLSIHLREVYKKEVGVIALFQDGEIEVN